MPQVLRSPDGSLRASLADVRGKRVVVFGLAGSGRAAARLAVERGAVVVGVDKKPDTPPIDGARLELGPHRIATFEEADLVVVSPGVPAAVPEIQAALAAGVRVIGEVHFAASFLDQPLAAITGTNGKSTVTHFTGQLLEHAGLRPFTGGNLGRPLSEAAFAENAGKFGTLAVEISSYQMGLPSGDLRPRIAAIMNLTPDHLARHGTIENYGAMKCRLFEGMSRDELALIPANDPLLARLADAVPGATRAWIGGRPGVVRDGELVAVDIPGHKATFDLSAFEVPGDHNRDNAALAALIALSLGARPNLVQEGIARLRALPHRMEIVAETGGITWINDSKATNVAAAKVGLAGLGRRGVLLLGGQAKGDAFTELVPFLGPWDVLTFGGSGDAIADELVAAGIAVTRCGGMADAVRVARGRAVAGDVVLLSPGCASFDEFQNFEHRGRVFRELANGVAA
jgi:UDP-N-acetylmuramoylalanine--D-glutamate ligase